MATRDNFQFDSAGNFYCSEFFESHDTYTSSTELPFYSSAEYFACANSLVEGSNKITYNTDGKALTCNRIIEAGSGGGVPIHYPTNSGNYVMGSATTMTELYQNFDPVLTCVDGVYYADNFDAWQYEVSRIQGKCNSVVLIYRKAHKAGKHCCTRSVYTANGTKTTFCGLSFHGISSDSIHAFDSGVGSSYDTSHPLYQRSFTRYNQKKLYKLGDEIVVFNAGSPAQRGIEHTANNGKTHYHYMEYYGIVYVDISDYSREADLSSAMEKPSCPCSRLSSAFIAYNCNTSSPTFVEKGFPDRSLEAEN